MDNYMNNNTSNINNNIIINNNINNNIFEIDKNKNVNDFIMYGKYGNTHWENMNLEQLVKFRTFLRKGVSNLKTYGKNKNYVNNKTYSNYQNYINKNY